MTVGRYRQIGCRNPTLMESRGQDRCRRRTPACPPTGEAHGDQTGYVSPPAGEPARHAGPARRPCRLAACGRTAPLTLSKCLPSRNQAELPAWQRLHGMRACRPRPDATCACGAKDDRVTHPGQRKSANVHLTGKEDRQGRPAEDREGSLGRKTRNTHLPGKGSRRTRPRPPGEGDGTGGKDAERASRERWGTAAGGGALRNCVDADVRHNLSRSTTRKG
jgi:hypothetical protein